MCVSMRSSTGGLVVVPIRFLGDLPHAFGMSGGGLVCVSDFAWAIFSVLNVVTAKLRHVVVAVRLIVL